MRLSPNFELDEFVVSREAAARGIDNTPPPVIVENLAKVANALEQIRANVLNGAPIRITSGYRCARLNAAVKGSRNSSHMDGLAVDFIAPQFGSPVQICHAIARCGFRFDQLIYEFTWVHLGIAQPMRHDVLTYQGDELYVPGIVDNRPGDRKP
jgi:zinc D-Ala-D-Ala carboxypeptidase